MLRSTAAKASLKAMGECRKRSPFVRHTTVILVVNGIGMRLPAPGKYSKGPSTIPMVGARGV
jgi:hypothetical protein